MYIKRNISAYAVAIFDLVKEENLFKEIQPQFEELKEIFDTHPEFIEYLKNTLIPEKERMETIDLILKDKHEIVINTVKVIIQRKATSDLHKIIVEYLKLSNKELKIRFLKVVSAFPLTEKQLELIKEKIQKVTRRTIELKNVVDPSLISGIRIESKTEVLELNLYNDLLKIKKELLNSNKKGA
ncbi:ATP synthase F1 subunit delta [Mycoplasma sp. NEAQ87857]|uniref:ATP synthase F1 subunit delta n=1 Tax=Mycoplasma sp. NEAQ87857 TaxID=2683967 RepID=UPI0013161FE7|nr:ATP synthase F1 subunit delta [Mycoplasma sp. NEAQ87857]QGZ97664.1 ATP synthase F1 subunit delta [Mycoplasma sp. NEAQ87857]